MLAIALIVAWFHDFLICVTLVSLNLINQATLEDI